MPAQTALIFPANPAEISSPRPSSAPLDAVSGQRGAARRPRDQFAHRDDRAAFHRLIETGDRLSGATDGAAPTPTRRAVPSEQPKTPDGETPVNDLSADPREGEFLLPVGLLLPQPFVTAAVLTRFPAEGASHNAAVDSLIPVAFDATGIDQRFFPLQTPLSGESASAVQNAFRAIADETQFRQLDSGSIDFSHDAAAALDALPVVTAAFPAQPANAVAGNRLAEGGVPLIGPAQADFATTIDQPLDRIADSPPSLSVDRIPQSDSTAAGALQPRIGGVTEAAEAAGFRNVFRVIEGNSSLTQPAQVAAAPGVEEQVETGLTDMTEEVTASSEGDLLPATDRRSSVRANAFVRQPAFAPANLSTAAATAERFPSGTRPVETGAVTPEPTGDESAADAELSSSRQDLSDAAAAGFRSVYRHAAVQALPRGLERISGQVADAIVTQAVMIEVGDSVTLDTILDPPELGRLHVRLTRTESGLTARVAAEKGDIQQVIAEHTVSIEQTVRTHLKTNEPMHFMLGDSPFGDGSAARGGGQEPPRPARLAEFVRDAGKSEELHRPFRRSQAEVDVLA
ncbi:MAG: hypothetical protein AB7U20_20050 [Planctomycetaceae bacterium]